MNCGPAHWAYVCLLKIKPFLLWLSLLLPASIFKTICNMIVAVIVNSLFLRLCLRNGRRERHMLAEEIMLLCFLLSRAILFPKEGKVSCHVVSPFLCACHHLTKVVEYLLSPSICHLFTWILHFLSRPTLYTLSDSISRLSLGQSVPCSCGRGTAIESWLPWGRISIDEI